MKVYGEHYQYIDGEVFIGQKSLAYLVGVERIDLEKRLDSLREFMGTVNLMTDKIIDCILHGYNC